MGRALVSEAFEKIAERLQKIEENYRKHCRKLKSKLQKKIEETKEK